MSVSDLSAIKEQFGELESKMKECSDPVEYKKGETIEDTAMSFAELGMMIRKKDDIIRMVNNMIDRLEDTRKDLEKEIDNLSRQKQDLSSELRKYFGEPPPYEKRPRIREDSEDTKRWETRRGDDGRDDRRYLNYREVCGSVMDEINAVVDKKLSSKVIFDTERDGWSIKKMTETVVGRSGIVFVVFVDESHVFGVYVGSKMETRWIDDPKIFLLSYSLSSRKLPFYSNLQNRKHEGKSIFKLGNESSNTFFQVADVIYIQGTPGKKESKMYMNIDDYFYNGKAKQLCGCAYPDVFEPSRVTVLQL